MIRARLEHPQSPNGATIITRNPATQQRTTFRRAAVDRSADLDPGARHSTIYITRYAINSWGVLYLQEARAIRSPAEERY